MRVITARVDGAGTWTLGLAGTSSNVFRTVTLTPPDMEHLTVVNTTRTFTGDPRLFRLAIQAHTLGIAYEYDPYFALSVSRVDPLPHQLEAVYDYLLKLARVRFLLADDAGAGKTIMAGLLIKELELRGLAERILIVCPSNLSFQWQRELKEKFEEKFLVLKGADIRDQFGVNQWIEQNKVITSLDLAKRTNILPGLRQVRWDLVIIDEAHRMSWTPPSKKTARYALGELLRDATDHILMLTATPHKGDPKSFTLFMQLLDEDAYADVKSISQAMEKRRAPFYLRRVKEAMVYFPERQTDGTWSAKKIFTKRIPRTVDFHVDEDEFNLYREVTKFVKRQSTAASLKGDDPRARAVGFLMALYQRRLASSTYALRRSLENRAHRLEERLANAQKMAALAPPDLPDWDELEEMEESERERLEDLLDAITMAENAADVKREVAELRDLAHQAQQVEDAECEAKLGKLKGLLQSEGFFDDRTQRLLIFTEFRDTLDYLVGKLKAWGFSVGCIHGGMNAGSREEPGTRLYVEQQFREGAIQVLVATEAAGEGINLQVCNILFNYDIPWNPNRLEQRMGRIHRYGQKKDCLIFNFVATNTIEGHVLARLLSKLQEIRKALEDDAVFNVVGEVLPAAHMERILRDYYAGKMGEADLEERLLGNVDEGHFRAICQNALEGLATKKLNLEMIVERRARAQERRVVPETIARFLSDAAEYVPMRLTPLSNLPHTFDALRTPATLRRYEGEPGWRLPPVASRYPRWSTDRETAEAKSLEWVTPGHPFYEAVRRHTVEQGKDAFSFGACFYSLQHAAPARLDFYRARVVDGLGTIAHEQLFLVEVGDTADPQLREPGLLGNLAPGVAPHELPLVATLPEPVAWLHEHALRPWLEETRAERLAEVERIAEHVELSLTELLQRADNEIGRANEEVAKGIQGAEGRLSQAENRHAELWARREKRRRELEQQKALTLQSVERIASALVLPHPERAAPEVTRLRPDAETEATAMRVVMEHERGAGRQVYDVHEKNLGYDVTSLDVNSGELRLIEVKGLGGPSGSILLTPNERRVAEDRRDCYWLYVVTNCHATPTLQIPYRDPARLQWREVTKVQHYWLDINATTQPMSVSDRLTDYGDMPKV
ncbi:MAG: DUF3883 domain-containing protein [Dehalococcoidia bacterium]|nr:DUF3883 domain-containing protein [Dehalococcoidia bacterium]